MFSRPRLDSKHSLTGVIIVKRPIITVFRVSSWACARRCKADC